MRRARLAAAAALLAAACSSYEGPTGPDGPPFTLRVEYTQEAGNPAPPVDPSCPHHNAPANLTLTTDWGEEIRLEPVTDRRFAGTLTRVPAGTHWLRLIDIIYCGSAHGPAAPEGVSLGGVELRRFADRGDGIHALLFSISSSGTVQP